MQTYGVFYSLPRAEVLPEEGLRMTATEVLETLVPSLERDGDFVGMVDSEERTFQVLALPDPGRFWAEVPDPPRRGSHGRELGHEELRALLGALPAAFLPDAFPDFRFELWQPAERPPKRFRLSADQIREVAPGYGACLATDRITVDGAKVGYMYREAPDNSVDSGWRFLEGTEDEAYMNDPRNHGVYDVNTIANYDPEILPFLDAPVGSAFARSRKTGAFVVDEGDPAD